MHFRKIINTIMDIISRREGQLTTVQRVRGGMMKGGNFNTWFAEIFVQFKGYSLGKLYSNGWRMRGDNSRHGGGPGHILPSLHGLPLQRADE